MARGLAMSFGVQLRSRNGKALLALVLGLVGMAQGAVRASAQASELRVQVLNGKTGRPVVNTHVMLWRDMGHAALAPGVAPQGTTDGEGYAAIPANDAEFVVVFVEGRQTCSKTFEHTFSLTSVRTRGLVSENACNAHIHMYAQAGTLVVFVRELTWYERMRGVK